MRLRLGYTDRSEGVCPGTSALVESLSKHSTPLAPCSASFCRSKCSPSTGVWSILKSPEWIIVPMGVWIGDGKAIGDGVGITNILGAEMLTDLYDISGENAF